MLPLLYCNGNDIIFCFLIVSIIGKLVIFLLEFFLIQIPFSNFYVYFLLDILSVATAVMGSLTPVQKEEKFLSTKELLEKIYKNSGLNYEKVSLNRINIKILLENQEKVLAAQELLLKAFSLLVSKVEGLQADIQKKAV